MKTLDSQKGITAVAVVIVIVLIGFAFFIVLKVTPVYIEYYGVVNSLRSLEEEDLAVRALSNVALRTLIRKRFDLNDVWRIKPEDVKIKKTGKLITIIADYEALVPLFGNVNLLFIFHREADLSGSTE